MSERTCTVNEPDDCPKPEHSRGLCQMHYRRLMKYGSTALPVQGKKRGPRPDPTKPYSKYRPRKPRVWVSKTHCPQGHPYDERNTYVNPDGYKQCRTCVRERMAERRPSELGQGYYNKIKTHCPKGHPYDDENTRWYKNRRACRVCARANASVQVIKKYGITLEQFEALMEAQEYSCAICRDPFEDASPNIDHDHKCCPGVKACGKCVRGLLCASCNNGLARFKDNPERLLNAALYLESA